MALKKKRNIYSDNDISSEAPIAAISNGHKED